MTTEFEHGTSFWKSRKSCGCDNGGCCDLELAGMSAAVTWVLWDVTQYPHASTCAAAASMSKFDQCETHMCTIQVRVDHKFNLPKHGHICGHFPGTCLP